jgi:site-specific DNA recombinase
MDAHWVHDRPGYRCRHGHTSARPADPRRPRNLYIREDHAVAHIADLHHRLGLGIWAPEDLAERLRAYQLVITTNGATWNIEPATGQQAPDSKEAHPRQTRMSFVG